MAHAFDHGLAKPLRTRVRDAMIGQLAPLLKANGGYLNAVEAFPRTIDGRRDDAAIDQAFELLKGRAPAVFVACGDKSYDPAGMTGYLYQATLTVQVIFLGNSARSLNSRLAGDVVSAASDTADPGLEVVMEHVEQLLIGRNFSIGTKVHVLVPASEEEIGTEKSESLWAQTYRIAVSRDVNQHRTPLESITEFMTTWRGKPAPASPTEHTFQALTQVTP